MQKSLFKFHHFSFQSFKFTFCHFNPLSFNSPQFSPSLIFHPFLPLACSKLNNFVLNLIFNIYLIIYFLIKKTLVNRNQKLK